MADAMYVYSFSFSFLIPSFLLGQESCVGLLVSAVVILFIGEDDLSQVITSLIFSFLFPHIYIYIYFLTFDKHGLATINMMIHFSTNLISFALWN